ncbi:MAG: hypothetical protein IPI04_14775 [Ignavibacteria bacterium]|nr:hypothetical protein [Ignavibacteria bacterium]
MRLLLFLSRDTDSDHLEQLTVNETEEDAVSVAETVAVAVQFLIPDTGSDHRKRYCNRIGECCGEGDCYENITVTV